MLVECGYVRATASDGSEWTFAPSLGRIASLGSPHDIVRIFAGLHGLRAEEEAAYVLSVLCEQDDPAPLLGWYDPDVPRRHPGMMPPAEQVILARHLMKHGIVGKATPGAGDGGFCDRFDAAEYIAAARVHLGLSGADAEAISMTELQTMLEMKYPKAAGKDRDLPSREEHDAAVAALEQRRG